VKSNALGGAMMIREESVWAICVGLSVFVLKGLSLYISFVINVMGFRKWMNVGRDFFQINTSSEKRELVTRIKYPL
jgi:hypothetical protein